MKKTIFVLIFALVFTYVTFAEIEVNNQTQYGMPITFTTSSTYPGDILIDGVYIYKTMDDYIVSILYSGGELAQWKDGDRQVTKTSFFNPPSGETVEISWINNIERITSKKGLVQYRVEKEDFESINLITVFLYDALYDNDKNDEDLNVYFKVTGIKFEDIPYVDTLVKGYEVTKNQVAVSLDTAPSSWVKESIEELQIQDRLRDEAYEDYTQGITRARFVYLMVELYETLTERKAIIGPGVSFTDTDDPYVLKAASLGITDGVSEGIFAPEQVLTREQMTTFIIKTLMISGKDMKIPSFDALFADDSDMSEWAKAFVYTAKEQDIIGGVGDNLFAPKQIATNEQALSIFHKLMKKYDVIEWANEYDGSRLFLKFEENLYRINLDNDLIINEEKDWLGLESVDDLKKVIHALLLEKKDLEYIKSENPNVKGTLVLKDYDVMKTTVKHTYSGVDKIGEVTTLEVDTFKAQVTYVKDGPTSYNNFDEVMYYDQEGLRHVSMLLPLETIAQALEINYIIEYDDEWDVFVLEVIEPEQSNLLNHNKKLCKNHVK